MDDPTHPLTSGKYRWCRHHTAYVPKHARIQLTAPQGTPTDLNDAASSANWVTAATFRPCNAGTANILPTLRRDASRGDQTPTCQSFVTDQKSPKFRSRRTLPLSPYSIPRIPLTVFHTSGSVQGARSNARPYRDPSAPGTKCQIRSTSSMLCPVSFIVTCKSNIIETRISKVRP